MNRPFRHWPGWTFCLLSGAVLPAAAQGLYLQQQEEPQWLKLHFISGSLGVYTEAVDEKSIYSGTGSSDYSRLFVGPSLGLNFAGSVYHPNLARFSLSSDGALGQGWNNSNGRNSSQFQYLGNALASVFLLGNKPYATTTSASETHTYSQYDFFSQTTVDTYRYGLQSGYREGNFPVNLSYWHTTENNSGLNNNFALDQDTLNFDVSNQRASGNSKFFYGLTDYSQSGMGVEASGLNQTWGVADNETLGRRKNMSLNSEANFSLLNSPGSSGDNANADANLNIEHTPTLSSGYGASYGRATYGSDTSENYTGSASLRHQLYESLTTSLNANGQYNDSAGPGGYSDATSYSLALSENYAKHLSTWGHLNISTSEGYSHTDISQNGTVIPINNEPHIFQTSSGNQIALLEPNVDATSIRIYSDTGHTFLYPEAGNYTVTQNGQITYITLISGSSIPQNTTVYISYTYTAVGTGSGSYDTTDQALQVRMDMWKGLLGLYGRVNAIQNSGTTGLVLNNSTSYALGADTAWRFLRAGAEYDVFDSTLSSYSSVRLYQTLMFHPSQASLLSFGFAESWTTFANNKYEQQMYSFINRYHRPLSRSWGFDIEDGISRQAGAGTDQILATVRPGLEFAKGSFSLKLGYDFEYARYLSAETRYYQTFFLRAKRTF